MPRYIDANALKESLIETLDHAKALKKECEKVGSNEIQIFAERTIIDFTVCILRLNNAPTIDAVKVVRCKDCKHIRTDNIFGGSWCQFPGILKGVKEKFFCAYGERREE